MEKWKSKGRIPTFPRLVSLSKIKKRKETQSRLLPSFFRLISGLENANVLARVPWRVPALLAHVLAHEIAHQLEGIGRHSAEGVMKALWDERDFLEMSDKPLPFAPEDLE
jgi:hypothetical protein